MSRRNPFETVPENRWETVRGWTERIDADRIKVTVEGRTHLDPGLPTTKRVAATTIIDDQVPFDYQRKMGRLVRWLEEGYVV